MVRMFCPVAELVLYLVHQLFYEQDPQSADLALFGLQGRVRVLPGERVVGLAVVGKADDDLKGVGRRSRSGW